MLAWRRADLYFRAISLAHLVPNGVYAGQVGLASRYTEQLEQSWKADPLPTSGAKG